MPKRKYYIEIKTSGTIEFDEDLLPDEDWRNTFYDINNYDELARYLAYHLFRGDELKDIKGFADKDNNQAYEVYSYEMLEFLELDMEDITDE